MAFESIPTSPAAANPLVCPLCGIPCVLEDCVTDAKGQAVHKACYRNAIINKLESL